MVKKLVLAGGLALVLALGLIAGRGTPTKAFVAPGIQDFNLDLVNCLVPAYPDVVSPNPELGYPQVCAANAEDKSVSGSVGYSTAIGLIPGNRQGFPYVYSGPGWVLQGDLVVPNGTAVGDVASTIDLYADGYKDVLGNASNCGGPPNNCPEGSPLTLPTTTPEDYVKQTLVWNTTSGCDGTDETFLNDILPGTSAMAPYLRYRACLTTVFLQGKYRVDIKALNGVTTPLNLVNLAPVWSPAGTYVNLISLGGEAASPTTGLLTQDTPQASISHTDSPYADNPAAAGLYVRWMTEISNEDAADRAINFVYSTSCKAIGGNFPDGDADCIPEASESGACTDTGWPTTPAVTIAGNPDSDGDGLLDGVEVAWGSNPCKTDSDLDGRTDTEEMVGPTQLLTNPKVADTDADGVVDGGLTLDANGDGVPDVPDVDGNGIPDAGISANLDTTSPPDGSSHRRVGFRIVGWDIEPDKAGTDNCPSVANGPTIPGPGADIQNNFDLDSATSWGHGDLYGDACDSDDENDNFPDTAEPLFQWDAGAHQCGNDKDLPGPATPLTLKNPDSDNDGVLDGSECWAGSNPKDAGDSPGAPATTGVPADKDALNNAMETDRRTQSFSNQPAPALIGNEDVDGDQGGPGGACNIGVAPNYAGTCGQSDSDSDGDTLSDGCEAFVTGTHPLRTNSDSIGPADASEPNLAARIAAYCKSVEDMDGDTKTDDIDNCPFVSNAAQTNTNPEIGNGKGIGGNDKTVPWSVRDDKRGDACDGDWDNDSLLNGPDTDDGGAALDLTYDDNNNGTWKEAGLDDGPSWDILPLVTGNPGPGNAKLDGVDAVCSGSLSDMPVGWATADADKDGLQNKWEFCKWASSPVYGRVDSDGDGKGDCVEAADVDGNKNLDFTGDVMYYAQAILLAPAAFGWDGDFDIDGNGNLDFTGDVMWEAQFGLIGTPGTLTGICK